MKQFLMMLSLLAMMTVSTTAQADQPFKTVQDLFAAMSARDGGAMRATSTPDFELLEVGEVWDMDKLVSLVVAGSKEWKRRNYFAVISTHAAGDHAWVSYWNRADFEGPEGATSNRRWLESAVLVKKEDKWLIEMLHSTILRDDQTIPADVELQEYVPE